MSFVGDNRKGEAFAEACAALEEARARFLGHHNAWVLGELQAAAAQASAQEPAETAALGEMVRTQGPRVTIFACGRAPK